MHRGLSLSLCGLVLCCIACAGRSRVPESMSDRDFWALSEALSEPAGTFSVSDNFVSNEPRFAENVRWLRAAGGAYVGVGPEQNFSYIARLRPAIAFIVDIRQENRNLHLLYKAIFELSSDRAEFVSRLFSRPRPDGLDPDSSVEELFRRYDPVRPSSDAYVSNTALIRERLVTTHRFRLSQADLDWIDRVYRAFYVDGPSIQFWGSRSVDAVRPSYRQLMTTRDLTAQTRSFLSSEEAYQFVKDLHARNMIVPVVGDFGGATALRRVAEYVRSHHDVVHAFYGSNVGVYLTTQQTRAFCRNLEALPAAGDAWFIDSDSVRSFSSKLKACAPAPK